MKKTVVRVWLTATVIMQVWGSISVCWALDTGTCMNHLYEVSQVIHLTPQANTGNCFS